MGVIVVVLIISFLVLIHELGHFWAAWWAKVRVFEFGLGIPPLARKLFTWRGVDFTLNWIPFGGFVRMAGEEIDEETRKEAKIKKEPAQPGFAPLYEKPWWKRLVVICAGAAVNIFFGIFIFICLSTWYGIPQSLDEVRIAMVVENSPAAAAGLPKNVAIKEIEAGGERLVKPSMQQLLEFVAKHRGNQVSITHSGKCEELKCDDSITTTVAYIRSVEETPEGEGALGVVFQDAILLRYSWFELPFRATIHALSKSAEMITLIWTSLGSMLSSIFGKGSVPSDLSGPIGIAYDFQKSGIVQEGLTSILGFMAVLSINLGVMNILPFPALDGGRAVFVILEQLLGKHRTAKVEHYAHLCGFIFLLALIALISARDIWRIVSDLLL